MARPTLACFLVLALQTPAAAQDNPPSLGTPRLSMPGAPPPGGMAPGMGGLPPGMDKPPSLTRADVERLIKLIPELAREGSKLQGGQPPMAGGSMTPEQMEDLQRIEALLNKHGTSFPVFFVQLTTLVATYLTLAPDEMAKRMPTTDSPQVKRILDDPNVPEADKQNLRTQLQQVQANKAGFEAQLKMLATDDNKKVVKPLLPKVKAALAEAEKISRDQQLKNVPKAGPPPPTP